MPCRSDHMEATEREVESRLVAAHLVYVFEQLGQTKNITPDIRKASKEYYGDYSKCHTYTALLCSTLTNMTTANVERIVYNAHSEESRNLASWWERHQAFDKQREAEELTKATRELKVRFAEGFSQLPLDEQERLLKLAKASP